MPANSCPPAASGSTVSCIKSQIGILRLKERRQSHPSPGLLSSRPAVFGAVDEHLAYVCREIFHSLVRLVRQIFLDGSQVNWPLYEVKVVRVLKQEADRERKVSDC